MAVSSADNACGQRYCGTCWFQNYKGNDFYLPNFSQKLNECLSVRIFCNMLRFLNLQYFIIFWVICLKMFFLRRKVVRLLNNILLNLLSFCTQMMSTTSNAM